MMGAGSQFTISDADASVSAQRQLAAGKKRPLIVKTGQMKSIERAARTYVDRPDTFDILSAVALVISTPVGRVIGNFMMGFNKSVLPTRLFTSEDEALDWLKEFL